jgi:hypothetical protein
MTQTNQICLIGIDIQRLVRKALRVHCDFSGMAPKSRNSFGSRVEQHKAQRHRIKASVNTQTCDAIFHPKGTDVVTPILASRQPQDLQRCTKIAQDDVRQSSEIDTELLHLKLHQQ